MFSHSDHVHDNVRSRASQLVGNAHYWNAHVGADDPASSQGKWSVMLAAVEDGDLVPERRERLTTTGPTARVRQSTRRAVWTWSPVFHRFRLYEDFIEV